MTQPSLQTPPPTLIELDHSFSSFHFSGRQTLVYICSLFCFFYTPGWSELFLGKSWCINWCVCFIDFFSKNVSFWFLC